MDDIAAQLRHYTLEEAIALIGDFLAELDEKQQARFLELVTHGPRPLVAAAMGLEDGEDLLDRIQTLNDDIANDVYVQDGVGFDPDYRAHRGFGDDSWIDEMDDLFAAADSLFRAGQFQVAAEAYVALFDIFHLSEDGFHFTRPNPAEALRTDVDAMTEHLFVAIGRSDPDPATTAIGVSAQVWWCGGRRYALLDAWASRPELMAADVCDEPQFERRQLLQERKSGRRLADFAIPVPAPGAADQSFEVGPFSATLAQRAEQLARVEDFAVIPEFRYGQEADELLVEPFPPVSHGVVEIALRGPLLDRSQFLGQTLLEAEAWDLWRPER